MLSKHFKFFLSGCLAMTLSTNIYAYTINKASGYVTESIEDETLIAISPDNAPKALWFIVTQNKTYQLHNSPESLREIVKLKASIENNALAVLSAGEGHPVLRVFKLFAVLNDRASSMTYDVDPYPGSLTIDGYKGHYLKITSDMLLTHLKEENRLVLDSLKLFSKEVFLLDLNTGDIKAVSRYLHNPVNYYGDHLLKASHKKSPMAELTALKELNDQSALPYLRKALKLEHYKPYKKEIQALIVYFNTTQ